MKLTKNLITRDEAFKLAPDYVAFIEGDWDKFNIVNEAFRKLKVGQEVIACANHKFVRGKVSSVKHDDFRAIDGPIIRVSNGEYSWRVDGDGYAYPVKG